MKLMVVVSSLLAGSLALADYQIPQKLNMSEIEPFMAACTYTFKRVPDASQCNEDCVSKCEDAVLMMEKPNEVAFSKYIIEHPDLIGSEWSLVITRNNADKIPGHTPQEVAKTLRQMEINGFRLTGNTEILDLAMENLNTLSLQDRNVLLSELNARAASKDLRGCSWCRDPYPSIFISEHEIQFRQAQLLAMTTPPAQITAEQKAQAIEVFTPGSQSGMRRSIEVPTMMFAGYQARAGLISAREFLKTVNAIIAKVDLDQTTLTPEVKSVDDFGDYMPIIQTLVGMVNSSSSNQAAVVNYLSSGDNLAKLGRVSDIPVLIEALGPKLSDEQARNLLPALKLAAAKQIRYSTPNPAYWYKVFLTRGSKNPVFSAELAAVSAVAN